MKKNILAASLFAVLGLTSCKKEKTSDTPTTPTSQTSSLIRIKTEVQQNTIRNYFYDFDGKVTKDEDGSIRSNYRTYEYTSNTSVLVKRYKADTLYSTRIYILNKDGYAIYTEYLDDNTIDTNYYDVNGFMMYSKNDQLTVKDGNVIEQITSNDGKKEVDTATYTYYLDRLNTIGESNHGASFFGKDSKNLLKTEKHTSYGGNFRTYTYDFDTKGRVIKRKINNILVSSYTYID